jgi:signal transduction histidine kinase
MRFPGEVEIALFRIAQESIHNAIRHSKAGRIDVYLEYEHGTLMLAVADDGVGFNTAESGGKGLGLLSMKERATAARGTLRISSRPGETRVEVRIPTRIRPPAEASSA